MLQDALKYKMRKMLNANQLWIIIHFTKNTNIKLAKVLKDQLQKYKLKLQPPI